MTSFRDYVATLEVKYTDSKDRDWYDLDTDTLPAVAQSAYEEYREANRLAAAKREKFEQITKQAIADPAILFGYKFGKLSFTMLDNAPKARSSISAKGKVSLSDWLAQNTANGR